MNFHNKKLRVLSAVVFLILCALFVIMKISTTSSGTVASHVQANRVKNTPLTESKNLADSVKNRLKKCKDLEERKKLLLKDTSIRKSLEQYPEVIQFLSHATITESYVLALTAALNQFDTLFEGFDALTDKMAALQKCVAILVQMENFYQPMGGLLGYHETVLQLLSNPTALPSKDQYLPPPFQDMRTKTSQLWKTCYEGVREFPRTAYIFPIGGASDRLNLIDEETKEQLPAASLLFLGRSLFEHLVRDVEAQSYWHYSTFGKQIICPIVLMTSSDKKNDQRIVAMGEQGQWFGHRSDAFFRMVQPQVLLVDFEGKWVSDGPLNLVLKPGGHGVIWKLAQDSGAFRWLRERRVDTAVVRQINNPLASLDDSFFTLVGYGLKHNKSFGFASCPSRPGFAEGLNILSINPSDGAAISNIEYTYFKTLQASYPQLFENSSCPANTNILFAYLPAIEKALHKDPIPGIIVNPKTAVEIIRHGILEKKMAARLESSMQNIADSFRVPFDPHASAKEQKDSLSTFLNLYDREKLISVTKKAYIEGQTLYETPESCFYDWTKAMRKLLSDYCQFTLPPEQTIEQFLQKGPEITFTFNPALGPLWEVIGQKFSHGSLAPGAEVELEIAELSCSGLTVDGTLKIIAKQPLGPIMKDGSCQFSDRAGRAQLRNCIIMNQGMSSRNIEDILKGKQEHTEECALILEGFSELIAENVTIKGDFHLTVPDGKRAHLTQDPSGTLSVQFEDIDRPSWKYKINWDPSTAPQLIMDESSSSTPR